MHSIVIRPITGVRRWAVGLFVLAAALLAQALPASAMTFSVSQLGGNCGKRCPVVIVATGAITSSTADDYINFLRTLGRQRINAAVLINSPGGDLFGSIKLGLAFRATRVAVIVGRVEQSGRIGTPYAGNCMSACAYAIMGGVKRYVAPASKVGIHRALISGSEGNSVIAVLRQSMRMSDDAEQVLRTYVRRMGVNPIIVDWAEKIGPGGIKILTSQEIRRTRLAQIR